MAVLDDMNWVSRFNDDDNKYHIYPHCDWKGHELSGTGCWCRPEVEDIMIVHNSLDRREMYENIVN